MLDDRCPQGGEADAVARWTAGSEVQRPRPCAAVKRVISSSSPGNAATRSRFTLCQVAGAPSSGRSRCSGPLYCDIPSKVTISGAGALAFLGEPARRIWVPTVGGIAVPRRGRRGGPYDAYVPAPPPELVPELLADLCAFCNDDGLPAIAQAAVAHAQFETIHPLADGNGRTGRALISMVLRRRDLAQRTTPPISPAPATQAKTYVEALTATRVVGKPAETVPPLNRWSAFFAAACRRAIADASAFEHRIEALQAAWNDRLGPARAHASARRLLVHLPAMPILGADDAAKMLGRQFWAANRAVARLVARTSTREPGGRYACVASGARRPAAPETNRGRERHSRTKNASLLTQLASWPPASRR